MSLFIRLVCCLFVFNFVWSSTIDYATYGKDYSCYHKAAWQENRNNHYNSIFKSFTGVTTSKYVSSSTASMSSASSMSKNSNSAKKHFTVVGGDNENIWTRLLRTSSYFSSFLGLPSPPLPSSLEVKRPLRGARRLAAPPPSGSGTPPPGAPPGGGGGGGSMPPSGSGTPPPGAPSGGGGGTLTSSGSVTTGWNAKFTGIPKYDHTFTTSEITSLDSRPKKSTDFRSNSATTAVAGEFIVFGEDINYSQSQCSTGFWPPGPVCPGNYSGSGMYDLEPAPEANAGGCYSSGTVGFFVSGVGAWSWTDGRSYNDASVWHNLAMEFEEYDMDVCLGHAAQSIYHHHSYSPCLATLLGDTGTDHSPIYGFANDAFPIYGPYQANGTLAQSCWKPRDYASTSSTGCSDGLRSCLLVDMFNYSLGTVAAGSSGPSTTGTVSTQSGNTITASSGVYIEDYYFDADCVAQGGEYLDAYNGHDHDNMGFHYHITLDSGMRPTFPYIVGPKFYGCQRGGKCSTSLYSASSSSSSSTSTCGTSSAVAVASQQCLSYSFQSNFTISSNTNTGTSTGDDDGDDGTSNSSSSSSNSEGAAVLTSQNIVIIGVIGGFVFIVLVASTFWYVFSTMSVSAVGSAGDIVTSASGQTGFEMNSSFVPVSYTSATI